MSRTKRACLLYQRQLFIVTRLAGTKCCHCFHVSIFYFTVKRGVSRKSRKTEGKRQLEPSSFKREQGECFYFYACAVCLLCLLSPLTPPTLCEMELTRRPRERQTHKMVRGSTRLPPQYQDVCQCTNFSLLLPLPLLSLTIA